MFSQLLFSNAFVPRRSIISVTSSYRQCASNLAVMSNAKMLIRPASKTCDRPNRSSNETGANCRSYE